MDFTNEEKNEWKVLCRTCHALVSEPCRNVRPNSIEFIRFMHASRYQDIVLLEYELELKRRQKEKRELEVKFSKIQIESGKVLSSFKDNGLEWLGHNTKKFDSTYISRFPALNLYVIIKREVGWELMCQDVGTLGYARSSAMLMQMAEFHWITNYIPKEHR